MFLLPPQGPLSTSGTRREIAVGERLLLVTRTCSHETVVASDGRIRLATGERIPAVRRTLSELSAASPRLVSVRRLPTPGTGFPLLSSGAVLRVAEGTTLLDALRGLPPVESVTVFDARDSAVTIPRAAFGTRRLWAGDALALGSEAKEARATILGGVLRPGTFDVAEGTTLGTLVASAGGLAPRALAGAIVIEREKNSLGPFTLPRDAATPLRGGDVIRVPVGDKAAYVSVAGAVKRPGLIEVAPDMTVAQAIEAAGGLTLPATSLLVSLRSITDPKRKSVKGKATELEKFPTLKGGDLLEIAPPPPRSQ